MWGMMRKKIILCLATYSKLAEEEREYVCNTVPDTIKLIVVLGYKIGK